MGWLSYAQSLDEAKRLKRHLERRGVKVSIELQRGAGSSGYWGHDWHRVEMSHHVVSTRRQGLTPLLWLIKKGRVDVPGPLSNGYGGFDMVYRIITMGLANHSGSGGPMTIDGVRIPKDDGRYYCWGTEFEGGLNDADWPPEYRTWMGKVNAGIIDWLRERHGDSVTDEAHAEHSSWALGRKSDRRGYTRARGIAEIKAARDGGTTTPEDDMPLNADDKHWISTEIADEIGNLHKAFNKGFGRDGSYTTNIWTHIFAGRPNTDMRGYQISTYEQMVEEFSKLNAKVDGLVGALAAVAGGEPFDRERLLADMEEATARGLLAVVGPRLGVTLDLDTADDSTAEEG